MYLLDTDICIYLLNEKTKEISKRLIALGPRKVATSAITAAELRYGALHSGRPEKNLQRVEQFLAPLTQYPFDGSSSIHFANIKQNFVQKGKLIGPMDLLIAGIALANDLTLVTNNTKEFSRVPDLLLDNWMK